jgi:hypothetical protein
VDTTISGNTASNNGGGLFALLVTSSVGKKLTIERSVISNNTSRRHGGGVYIHSYGTPVDIVDTTISGNTAFGASPKGGGLYARLDEAGYIPNEIPSALTINRSTISGNSAQVSGGGFFTYLRGEPNKVRLLNSTLSGNRALNSQGGGAYVCSKFGGQFEAINSTISGNDAMGAINGKGGGLYISRYAFGTALLSSQLHHVTITNNAATSGGGLFSNDVDFVETSLFHTIVSGNRNAIVGGQANNVGGDIENVSAYNLFGTGGGAVLTTGTLGPGNILNNDAPGLAGLANNGGPTMTHALSTSSPARNSGDPAFDPNATTPPRPFDQRGAGFPREFGSRVDIGAYEAGFAKVVDVVVKGSGWAAGVEYPYADVVAAGDQLRPMFMQGANRIAVRFDGPVSLPTNEEDALSIIGNNHDPIAATIGWVGLDPTSQIATWSLSSPLGVGKYALMVSGITDSNGLGLDGDYTNFHGPDEFTHTYDDFSDDKGSQLVSGDGNAGGVFEFHFSVLPGDYNQDGIITSDDSVSGIVKDGDGDGNIEAGPGGHDTAIASPLGAELPLRTKSGDYANGNEDNDIVFTEDYLKWRATFGNTGPTIPPLPADGSVNGIIDAADYVWWRDHVGLFSAWRDMPVALAAGIPVIDFGGAPRVTNVIISGSISVHTPYSFDAHDGSGEQLRTVPVGGADTISVLFSEDVNIAEADLHVVGLYRANLPEAAEFDYDPGTMTAVWRFETWFIADQYLIRVDDAVTDIEGNRLDGEWVNPAALSTVNAAVSEFPSGNGSAGGAFNFVMTIMPGDANLNNIFTQADIDIFNDSWMEQLEDALFTDGDASGDGWANSQDFYFMPTLGMDLQNLWILADLDDDDDVDQSDVDTLVSNFSKSNPTWSDGDLNDDNVVDEHDLDLAFAQFGLSLSVVS